MRVRADDHLARQDDALLREDDVLDAGVADLIVVDDALLLREVAHELDLRRGGDVLGGRVMVGHEGDALGVEDRRGPHLAQHLDGYRRRNVVGENQVELTVDEIPGSHRIFACGPCQQLLRYGHGRTSIPRPSVSGCGSTGYIFTRPLRQPLQVGA